LNFLSQTPAFLIKNDIIWSVVINCDTAPKSKCTLSDKYDCGAAYGMMQAKLAGIGEKGLSLLCTLTRKGEAQKLQLLHFLTVLNPFSVESKAHAERVT
jgi:hypothetical protein